MCTAAQHALHRGPVAWWAVIRFLAVGRSTTVDERPIGSYFVGRWLFGARDSASSALVGVEGAFEAELLVRGLDELRLVPN